jgi:hypothetical protein
MVLSIWSDFYGVSEPTPNKQQLYTSRQTRSASSVYVLDCLFNGLTSSGYGGALYCSTSVTYLLVESSSFFSCNTNSSYGGAIYFFNTNNGQSVLYKVCGNDCCSTYSSGRSDGQFAYIAASNGTFNKNYANFTSISRCMNEKTNSMYILHLVYGKTCSQSINISMNKCYRFSAIRYTPFCNSSSSSFSTFADNIAFDAICIGFYAHSAKFELKCCNILRNTQGTLGSWGTFEAYGDVMIKDSCVLENVANRIFFGTITLSKCTVDQTTNNGKLTIQSTVTKSFIYALNHILTQNCHGDYAVGTRIPILPSLNTCRRFDQVLPQGNFVSFTSILVFNFINPFASGDRLC